MKQDLIYVFTYKLYNGIIGEIEIKAKNFYSACEKFDDWKIEKGLDTDKDNEIVDLKYRVSGLTDIYEKEQRTTKKNKYVVINMETLRIDLVKKDLSNVLVPFDIADSTVNNNHKELLENICNIIGDYQMNDREEN